MCSITKTNSKLPDMAFKMYLFTTLMVSEILAINNRVVFNGYNLTDISDYGCWCRFTEGVKRHGEPLDEIDRLCHVYWQNIHCMQAEELIVEESDLRSVQPAMINAVWATETSDVVSQCEAANEGNSELEKITCKLHANFVFNIFQQFFSGSFVREEYKVRNGFEFEDNCHAPDTFAMKSSSLAELEEMAGVDSGFGVKGNAAAAAGLFGAENSRARKECCGEYPLRTPFVPAFNRGCCGNKTFDTTKNICCGTSLVNFGEQC